MTADGAVWITGVGASTPVGHSFEAIAENLLEGRSGIRAVTEFPVATPPNSPPAAPWSSSSSGAPRPPSATPASGTAARRCGSAWSWAWAPSG